jgi:hypothetical protein
MNPLALPFVVAAALGLLVWGLLTRRYLWPYLSTKQLTQACEPILYLHAFRYLGLSFIAQGVVGSELNPTWAQGAAFGDVTAAILALVALATLKTSWNKIFLWVFNVVGFLDLLRASVLGPVYDVPVHLNATFFIPVFFVPLLIWTHVMVFLLLTRKKQSDLW